jgi:hypothetical protein
MKWMKYIMKLFHWGINANNENIEKKIANLLKQDNILKQYMSFEPGICTVPLYQADGDCLLIWFPYKKELVNYINILTVTKRIASVTNRGFPENIKAIQIAHCLKEPDKVHSIAKLTYYLSPIKNISPGIDNIDKLTIADLQRKITPETTVGVFQVFPDYMITEGIYITWYWDNQHPDKPMKEQLYD